MARGRHVAAAGVLASVWLLGASSTAAPVRDGAEIRANSVAERERFDAQTACGSSGECVVVWYMRESSPAPNGIFARCFDRVGRPKGNDFQVNAYTAGDHINPTVAADAAGNFVVAWEGETENAGAWEIRARRFSRDGAPLTGDLTVSTSPASISYTPAVAVAPDGRFVVAWTAYPGDDDGSGLLARRFDAAGAALGAPFQLNATTEADQDTPSLAMDVAGGFFAAWRSYGQDGDSWGMVGRRFNASGTPAGGEVVLNTTIAGAQYNPVVTREADGGFFAAWESDEVDVDVSAAVGRRFDAAGVPRSAEIPLNTTGEGYQWAPSLACPASGGTIATWTSEDQDGDGGGIFGRLFDKAGLPASGEFQVNSTTAGYQYYGRVASDGAGNFVVAWDGPDPDTGSYEIFAQRFSNERQVNAFAAGAQGEPKVGIDGSGKFIVAWDSFGQDGQWEGVFSRVHGADGAPSGAEFQVNSYTTVGQYQPAITSNVNGGFVVVWSSAYQDGSGYGVFGQRFDGAGARSGAEFQVNATTQGYQETPAVARRTAGDFVVVWSSYGQDGSSYAIVGQKYATNGAADGGEFIVNTTTAAQQTSPAVAKTATGEFLVVWESAGQDGSGWGIAAQRYDASGYAVGGEIDVNTTATGDQRHPAVGVDGFGNAVIVWDSVGQDGSGGGVYGRRFDAAGTALGAEFALHTTMAGDQAHPVVSVDASGRFVVAWETQDTDGSATNVVAREFGPDGLPVGGEIPVNAARDGIQRRPSVALDDAGRYVVAWESDDLGGSGTEVIERRFIFDDASAGASCAAPTVGAPAGTTVCAGASISLTVAASGVGPPTFRWRKDGIDLADGGRIAGSGTATLHIAAAVAGDAGAYSCVVTDACAPQHAVTSAAAVVAVQPAPTRVGDTLHTAKVAGQLNITWSDLAGFTDYVVYEDASPAGAFVTVTGTAATGVSGITVPLPAGIRFYRVAAKNAVCGDGPKD